MQIKITSEYLASQELSETFPKRFWKHVNKNGPKTRLDLGECWQWSGASVEGYGYPGKGHADAGNILAHRASWILHKGPIPEGLWVLHKCDNPACVNPNHLFLGSNADNIRDRDSKGRQLHGETHPRALLTQNQIEQIRQLYSDGQITQKAIGIRFGVARRTICHIVNRTSWISPSQVLPLQVIDN